MMKKHFVATILLSLALALPFQATAGVDVGVSISLPLPIVFVSPPELVVIPETYVYVVPDIDADIYFYNGWWWRPWEGRWYRSRHYDSGWAYYQRVPIFFTMVPSGWRNDYRDHRWGGQPWNYQRIPHQDLQRNWSGWEKNRHWEKQQTWGVQGLKPRTKPQPPRQPSREVQPRQSRQPAPEAAPRQSRPPASEAKPQQSRPPSREAQPQQSRPPSRETQPQKAQPQRREQPRQSEPERGRPDRGGDGKQDRN